MCHSEQEYPINVSLIGMPAVGKSTLGVLLAKRLGFAFVDTDLIIQSMQKATLAEIIGKVGMEAFCRIEARAIKALAVNRTVIATGGSAVYIHKAMSQLARLSRIVFLNIELDCLVHRLNNIDSRGVIYKPGQTMEQLYTERLPLYRRYAQHTLDCTDRTPEQLVRQLEAELCADPLFQSR